MDHNNSTLTMIDEILVHISAPATRYNDNLYRTLADSYRDFEPYIRYADHLKVSSGEHIDCSISSQIISATSEREILNEIPGNASILSTSKESYGSFPSFMSSEDGQPHATCKPNTQSVQGSAPTSSRLAQLEHIHRKWQKQNALKPGIFDKSKDKEQALVSTDDIDTAFIEDTQMGFQDLQSQLYNDYSATSEGTSVDESEPDVDLQQVCIPSNLPVQIQASQASNPSSSARLVANAKDECVDVEPQTEANPDVTTTAPISSPYYANKVEHRTAEQNIASTAVDLTKLPFDVFPPAPKISVARPNKFPSQVTNYLKALQLQSPSRFRPSRRVRVPKDDDRGYWLVNCSPWPITLQSEFWSALSDHIGSGRLGWGTTLHRNLQSAATLGQIRLYCWGEVVEHMWLLLWLCSHGKVAGAGPRWYDADSVAIIEVP